MTLTTRLLPPVAGLAALLALAGPGARVSAQDAALPPLGQAAVATLALFAADGEREEGGEPETGGDQRPGNREWSRGMRGRGEGQAMMREIMDRLERLERRLAERGPLMGPGPGGPPPGGPGRGGDWRGRGRPDMTPELRQQWEERMKEGRERMEAAREKWQNASEEERAEMKEKWEARMQEGRAMMEAAREKWQNASEEERAEMKKQREARMREAREKTAERRPERADGPPMPEARRMVDEARRRARELEARVKRLEAELERRERRAEGPADEEF